MRERIGRRAFLTTAGSGAALTAGCLGGGGGNERKSGRSAPGGDATMRTGVTPIHPRMHEAIENFETLRVRFEKLATTPVEGDRIVFDPVDRTKDLTTLGGEDWTVVDDTGTPSGTYERTTFHLAVTQAEHSSEGPVEYDSGSQIEKPHRNLRNEPIEFHADRTNVPTLLLNPSKHGRNWHFVTGYSAGVAAGSLAE